MLVYVSIIVFNLVSWKYDTSVNTALLSIDFFLIFILWISEILLLKYQAQPLGEQFREYKLEKLWKGALPFMLLFIEFRYYKCNDTLWRWNQSLANLWVFYIQFVLFMIFLGTIGIVAGLWDNLLTSDLAPNYLE